MRSVLRSDKGRGVGETYNIRGCEWGTKVVCVLGHKGAFING